MRCMTTREKLIRDVLDLPEAEIEPVAEFIASRGTREGTPQRAQASGNGAAATPAKKVGRLPFFSIGAGGPADVSERVDEFVGRAINRRHPAS